MRVVKVSPLLITLVMLLILVLAGCNSPGVSAPISSSNIPPLDARIPLVIETASFALG
jgi:hypothetical protein